MNNNIIIFVLLLYFNISVAQQRIEFTLSTGLNYNFLTLQPQPAITASKPLSFSYSPFSNSTSSAISYNYKRIGIGVGVYYSQSTYKFSADEYVGYRSEWIATYRNVLFPVQVLYRAPIDNTQLYINFHTSAFIGFTEIFDTKSYLNNPFVGNYDSTGFIAQTGFNKNSRMKAVNIGTSIGLDFQPFKRSLGLLIGLEYNYCFTASSSNLYQVAHKDPVNVIKTDEYNGGINQSWLTAKVSYRLSWLLEKKKKPLLLNRITAPYEAGIERLHEHKKTEDSLLINLLCPYINFGADWVHLITPNINTTRSQFEFQPDKIQYTVGGGIQYMISKQWGVGLGVEYHHSSYHIQTLPSSYADIGDTYFKWETSLHQFTFPLSLVYRQYFKQSKMHMEFATSLYAGMNRYDFDIKLKQHIGYIPTSTFLATIDFDEPYEYTFAAGFSERVLFHPFQQNVSIKIGLQYQIDFTRMLPIRYSAQIDNQSKGYSDIKFGIISPTLSKLSLLLVYCPSFHIGKRKGR